MRCVLPLVGRLTSRSTRLYPSPSRFTKQLSAKVSSPFSSTAAMANVAPPPAGKFEFLVILPDVPDSLSRRLDVRPKHFAGLQAHVDTGFLKVGGAILEEVPKGDDPLKFAGSAIVCVAGSKEEVIEILKKDIYAESNVWDFSKVQIYPFKCAIRYQ